MKKSPTPCSFRPALEVLERRELPSSVNLGGLINTLNADASRFQQSQQTLVTLSQGSAATATTVTNQYLGALGNYQLVLNDQRGLQSEASSAQTSLTLAAASSGNQQLFLYTLLVIDPFIQNQVNQANNTVNGLSAQVNATYTYPHYANVNADPFFTASLASHTR
jgi:hypothetical protein